MRRMAFPLLLALAFPASADAARCKQGMIYRTSQGVCVSKASAQRAGIYRAGYTKRHESRRARIEARRAKAEAAKERKIVAAERRPVTMPMSPMMATIAPDPFMGITNPYGLLVVPLPAAFERHVLAWAAENRHRIAVEIAE